MIENYGIIWTMQLSGKRLRGCCCMYNMLYVVYHYFCLHLCHLPQPFCCIKFSKISSSGCLPYSVDIHVMLLMSRSFVHKLILLKVYNYNCNKIFQVCQTWQVWVLEEMIQYLLKEWVPFLVLLTWSSWIWRDVLGYMEALFIFKVGS